MFLRRYDVFLSYSRADTERVAPVRDGLRRMGYRVFFDVQSIDPGSPWKERLRRAIRASRTLVLCWSENTRGSEYVAFEYSQAEAFRRPIFPWRLDQAPLPAMMDLQAIGGADAAAVAARLKPGLGWPLRWRRASWLVVTIVVAALLGAAVWHVIHPPPPPPWDFQGEVTDRVTSMPIAGAEVDVLSGDTVEASAFTNAQGRFDVQLPAPRPKTIRVRLRKDGYGGEPAIRIPSDQPWDIDMSKLP